MIWFILGCLIVSSVAFGWTIRELANREYLAEWKMLRDDTEQLLEADRRMIHDAQELFAKIEAYGTTPTRGSDE